MTFNVESPWSYRDALGEGPIWDAESGRLIRVDCERGLLHLLDVETGGQISHHMGAKVGFAAKAHSGETVVSVWQDLIAVAEDGSRRIVGSTIEADLDDEGQLNDGKCDPHGRLFAGTLDPSFSGKGGLYKFDNNLLPKPLVTGVSVSNGLDWDLDRGLMYWTDSLDYRIDVFDYDVETGEASGRRPFVAFDRTNGMPDGMTLDEEGGLWVAMFQGGAVHRYEPSGMLTDVVKFPTSCPTSIAIGGPNGTTAYVTSSQSWLSDEQKLSQPQGGAVFTFDAGVRGTTPGVLTI